MPLIFPPCPGEFSFSDIESIKYPSGGAGRQLSHEIELLHGLDTGSLSLSRFHPPSGADSKLIALERFNTVTEMLGRAGWPDPRVRVIGLLTLTVHIQQIRAEG